VHQLGEPVDTNVLSYRTGLPVCDACVDSRNRCLLASLGADERDARLAAREQDRRKRLDGVEAGEHPSSIEAGCKAAAERAAAEMRAHGCGT
jgi:hypothetical protein